MYYNKGPVCVDLKTFVYGQLTRIQMIEIIRIMYKNLIHCVALS